MGEPKQQSIRGKKNNPYQLLIVALLFFIPGISVVLYSGQGLLASSGGRDGWRYYQVEQQRQGKVPDYSAYENSRYTALSKSEVRTIGIALLIASASFTWSYFYVRKQMDLDDKAPHRRRK